MATPQTRRAPNPGETNSRNDQPARISAAILATVALPVPFKRAVFLMPFPAAREARTASSRSGDIFGRPNAFPLLVPAVRALAMPARTLSTIRLRSNSRINSYRWYPQPANVSADYSTAPRATNVRSAPLASGIAPSLPACWYQYPADRGRGRRQRLGARRGRPQGLAGCGRAGRRSMPPLRRIGGAPPHGTACQSRGPAA